MDATTTRGTCRVSGGGRPEGPSPRAGCWSQFPAGREAARRESAESGGREAPSGPLSAQTDRQAVPRVCVFFPPPAGAVVLVVAPVAHGGPHASTAHGAVRAALAVAVRALHGQFHATVLLERQRGQQGHRPPRSHRAPRPREDPHPAAAERPPSHVVLPLPPPPPAGDPARPMHGDGAHRLPVVATQQSGPRCTHSVPVTLNVEELRESRLFQVTSATACEAGSPTPTRRPTRVKPYTFPPKDVSTTLPTGPMCPQN